MKYAIAMLALMPVFLMLTLWTGVGAPAMGQLEGSRKWDRARDLSRNLEMMPTDNLDTVSHYIEDLFRDTETSRIFFSDYPESTSSLRTLVRALLAHAKQACDNGDWTRGERAFGLAIRLVRGVLELKPPERIPIGREPDGKEIHVHRGVALVQADALAGAAVFLITERLQQIANTDKQCARLVDAPLQRAKEIRAAQRKYASKALPLLRKGDYRQLDRISEEHLSVLRSLIDRWEREVIQSLRQIQVSLPSKIVQ